MKLLNKNNLFILHMQSTVIWQVISLHVAEAKELQ